MKWTPFCLLGDEIRLWDEFHPNLYQLKVSLTDEEQNTTDSREESFGMRDFKVVDGCITVNNRPVFYVVRWIVPLFRRPVIRLLTKKPGKRIFTAFQAHGLNHVRFHPGADRRRPLLCSR